MHMKKFFLLLLLSIFTLTIGFAYSPVITDIDNIEVLSPTKDVTIDKIIAIDGGINLIPGITEIADLSKTLLITDINRYTIFDNIEVLNIKQISLIQKEDKEKRNLKKSTHIRLKRRLSDTEKAQY